MIKTKGHSDCSVVKRSGSSRTGCGYSSEGAIATRYAAVDQRGREFANGVRSEGAAWSRLQGTACTTLIMFVYCITRILSRVVYELFVQIRLYSNLQTQNVTLCWYSIHINYSIYISCKYSFLR